MKCVIVYWSRFGNGKKVVEYLSERLKKKKAEVHLVKTDEADPAALPDADVYVFSAPTEAFNIQRNMKLFMKKLRGMEGKKYGIINTHNMKRSWLNKMEKLLNKKQMEKRAAIDFRMGKDTDKGEGLPEGWKKTVDEFVEKLPI